MKICICDDDLYIHGKIEKLIEKNINAPSSVEVIKASSGEELLILFGTDKKPDIIFLDIEMQGMNGIMTAEKIREISENTILIFVSGYSEFVFETFRLDALHFIRKPISEKEFDEVFARAMLRYNTLNESVTIRWQGERVSVPIDKIICVEGYNRHIIIHTVKEKYEAVGRLRDIFSNIESHGFVYVHQGYIVNMNYIRRFGTEEIILHGGMIVPVSVRKRQQALQRYDDFIQKRMW